jgi:hypothetical protein
MPTASCCCCCCCQCCAQVKPRNVQVNIRKALCVVQRAQTSLPAAACQKSNIFQQRTEYDTPARSGSSGQRCSVHTKGTSNCAGKHAWTSLRHSTFNVHGAAHNPVKRRFQKL